MSGKKLMLAVSLLVGSISFLNAFNSINIDVDLGETGNVLEKVGNYYYKAFALDNGVIVKSDIRLREAENAKIGSTGYTQAGINEIFNLTKGSIVPTDSALTNNIPVNITDLVSTESPKVKKIKYYPGIDIYSSNDIQIKRGYLFSQEFLRFFNTNLLLEALNGYSYTKGTYSVLSDADKQKSFTVLTLLDKFNIRSFTLFYNNRIDEKYSSTMNGLNNLETFIKDTVKSDKYKQILLYKIADIKALLSASKALYNAALTEKINIPRYKIIGNNKIARDSDRVASLEDPYIEYIDTRSTGNYSQLLYSVDKTHIMLLRPYNYYCANQYFYTTSDGVVYYWWGWGARWWGCDNTRCSYSNYSSATDDGNKVSSYSISCLYKIDVNTARKMVQDVINIMNQNYGEYVNNIVSKASSILGKGNSVQGFFQYLTDNCPLVDTIYLNVSDSFASRDVNALYRSGSNVNMLDFMDDIQELVGLKQYRYTKDTGVVRSYETAFSLSNFHDNSTNTVSPSQLNQEINAAVETSNQEGSGGSAASIQNAINSSPALAEKYNPITPSNFSSSGKKLNQLPTPSQVAGTKTVSPSRAMLVYLNSFDTGVGNFPFVWSNTSDLLNKYMNATFQSGVFAENNGFAWGEDNDNKKYFLGKVSLNPQEQYKYLVNSFALFGVACTNVDNTTVCTLAQRHVDSSDNWIDIGEDNILTLYNLLLDKIDDLNNVNLDKSNLTATLTEIDGIFADANTGETSEKLTNILNGTDKTGAMEVNTFMPFKAEGLLIQTHYEIRHYVPAPVYTTECTQDGNCTEVLTGETWKYVYSDFPDYSCNAGLKPVSKVKTMLVAKTYGNFINGELGSPGYKYTNIGDSNPVDAAVFIEGETTANNNNTVIGGTASVPYSYLVNYVNPNANTVLSEADCLAHGLSAGCAYENVGSVISCGDLGSDDFYRSHAVIKVIPSIKLNALNNTTSQLIYEGDYQALTDSKKLSLVNADAALLYKFNGKMPGVGTSGFDDETNIYKKIFLDGMWKDTVITDTKTIDLSGNSAGVTLYDCNGKLQTYMCTESELPPINTGGNSNQSNQGQPNGEITTDQQTIMPNEGE